VALVIERVGQKVEERLLACFEGKGEIVSTVDH
jgi:hypothetical protein